MYFLDILKHCNFASRKTLSYKNPLSRRYSRLIRGSGLSCAIVKTTGYFRETGAAR